MRGLWLFSSKAHSFHCVKYYSLEITVSDQLRIFILNNDNNNNTNTNNDNNNNTNTNNDNNNNTNTNNDNNNNTNTNNDNNNNDILFILRQVNKEAKRLCWNAIE